jgi:hypothetical protein
VPLEDATVYSWDATYRAAVLETEPAKVFVPNRCGGEGPSERLAEVEMCSPEYQAIERAQKALSNPQIDLFLAWGRIPM